MEQVNPLYFCVTGGLLGDSKHKPQKLAHFTMLLLFPLNPDVHCWGGINRLTVILVPVSKKNLICQLSWQYVRKYLTLWPQGSVGVWHERRIYKCPGNITTPQSACMKRLPHSNSRQKVGHFILKVSGMSWTVSWCVGVFVGFRTLEEDFKLI